MAEEKVPVVTTGAGNPSRYMPLWKEAGVKVVPVVASVSMARLVTKAGATAIKEMFTQAEAGPRPSSRKAGSPAATWGT